VEGFSFTPMDTIQISSNSLKSLILIRILCSHFRGSCLRFVGKGCVWII